MTRYSASRGIMYSAPPNAEDESDATETAESTDAAADPTPADD